MDILKSSEINELASALSKAQSEIIGAKADSKNPFFKSSYADLASVWEAIRGPLTKNGLSISQVPVQIGDIAGIRTFLMHSSGQWIAGDLIIKPMKMDPQSTGSAISYARRYALAAMVGVAQIDDDAETSMHRKKEVKHEAFGKPREDVPLPTRDFADDDIFPNQSGPDPEYSNVGAKPGRPSFDRGGDRKGMEEGGKPDLEKLTKILEKKSVEEVWSDSPVRATKAANLIREEILRKRKVDPKLIQFFEVGVTKGFLAENVK